MSDVVVSAWRLRLVEVCVVIICGLVGLAVLDVIDMDDTQQRTPIEATP